MKEFRKVMLNELKTILLAIFPPRVFVGIFEKKKILQKLLNELSQDLLDEFSQDLQEKVLQGKFLTGISGITAQ